MADAVFEVSGEGRVVGIVGQLPSSSWTAIGARLEDLLAPHPDGGRPLDGIADGSAPAAGNLFVLRRDRGLPIAVQLWSAPSHEDGCDTLVALRLSERATAAARELRLKESLARKVEEAERLRLQLDELEAIRTHFLSASAHELKTPLTVIQSYLETLITDLAPGLTEEQLSFLHIAYEGVLRLRRLVVDLVDLAALSSGKIRLEIGPVPLAPLVHAELLGMQTLAERGGVELVSEPRGTLGVARADPARVQQVIRNLLDNAIKFTPAGGSVAIEGSVRDDSVIVSVSDTGLGIPADRLPVIFDAFFQAGPNHERGRRGAGLGLAISRRIALSLGGRIEATSQENEGSTFSLHLPQWPEDESGPARPAQG